MNSLESHVMDLADGNLSRNEWDVPLDYFSWGRDKRHREADTELLPVTPVPRGLRKKLAWMIANSASAILGGRTVAGMRFRNRYSAFEETYQLMSDDYSRNLFAELILMKLVSEHRMRLSSFTRDFVSSYESASDRILEAGESMPIYNFDLRKITLEQPPVSFYTVPTILNLHYSGVLYRYERDNVLIEVEGGDVVLDAGVGWGDTTIYLAALANGAPGGQVYAFDILKEGLDALGEQCRINPGINIVNPVYRALSERDGEKVNITTPGPGARVVAQATERAAETITIDTFAKEHDLPSVDFIKMDIEGSEVPALKGGADTIRAHKPKLAISVYHKWDDLLVIPKLIHGLRSDYNFYLNCTTGFGGETILYCN